MAFDRETEKRIEKLKKAFNRDHFEVDVNKDVDHYKDKIGICAYHRTAVNYETGQPKRAYYLEGSAYEMGYLLGKMAEKEVALMTKKFVEYVPFAFLGLSVSPGFLEKIIHSILRRLFWHWTNRIKKDIPQEYIDEMDGILAGCRAANPDTKVNEKELWILNVGIDAILSHLYPGKLVGLGRMTRERLKIPVMCNAFSVFGKATDGGNNHYFGRDFMFPTAGVFQNVACLIIYNPDAEGDRKPLPIVSQTAPGMVGTAAGMNRHGVAIGVDMSPSAACNPGRPGFNSLLLCRHAIQYGDSAEEAAKVIADAPRGVSWLYPIADGRNDKAAVVEAIQSLNFKNDDRLIRFLRSFPPRKYRSVLPKKATIKKILQQYSKEERKMLRQGLMVRWSSYQYPIEYLEFNENLRERYNKNLLQLYKIKDYNKGTFSETGFINNHYTEKNCPGGYYFAPQRESRVDLIMDTNICLVPELRFTIMTPWICWIASHDLNDIQWRYDRLNSLVLKELDPGTGAGHLNYKTAKQILDFLSPRGKFNPCYYDRYPRSQRSPDAKEIAIYGSTSLFDLKKKTIESHFGYYCDEWVKITLPNYID